MKFWDKPIQTTYRIPAADLTGGARIFAYIQGPPGARGRIQFLQTAVTTNVTVAAAAILVGISGDTDKFLSFNTPVSSAGAVLVTRSSQVSHAELSADTVIQIGTDGAATAGAADINLCVAWERE